MCTRPPSEDLKVAGSIPGFGILHFSFFILANGEWTEWQREIPSHFSMFSRRKKYFEKNSRKNFSRTSVFSSSLHETFQALPSLSVFFFLAYVWILSFTFYFPVSKKLWCSVKEIGHLGQGLRDGVLVAINTLLLFKPANKMYREMKYSQ